MPSHSENARLWMILLPLCLVTHLHRLSGFDNVSELVRRIIMGWVTEELYPKMGTRVYPTPLGGVYPTLRHMGGVVKQLELLVYGVRTVAIVEAQAEREELYRMAE